jgi:hypothetical protein
MAGGLIQLVSSGKQDGYLTYNPQITFFKKVYRRHTIFGIELLENYPEQQPQFDNRVTFLLNNISDLISKCYIEIEIPPLYFQESKTVTTLKQNDLENIQKEINKWKTLYDNLKSYCSIEILLYQNLNQLLQSINITLNTLKQNVIKFNSKYKKQKESLTNLISDTVFYQIDLTGYILQLNKMIVDENYEFYDPTIQIKVSELLIQIDGYYNNMIKNLKYYYSNYIFNVKKYEKLKNNFVNFAWNKYLAHIYFTDYEVEIGGQVMEQYSLEQSLIYQLHHLPEEQMENYNKMIGNTSIFTDFDNNPTPNQTIILPLNFWFCKDIGSSLPVVALSNSSIAINLKVNNLKNILFFEDLEREYYDFLIITVPKDDDINKELNFSSYKFDIDSNIITYNCININYKLMALQYPSLSTTDRYDDISEILQMYGKMVDGEFIMELEQWIKFRQNYTKDQNVINPKSNNNFNEYYSMVPQPIIKLVTESVYLDDVERNKFASTKLEYVVELFQQNIFDLEKQTLVSGELSIDRPVKELMWITQPKVLLEGLSQYGKTYITEFEFNQFFKNNYYNSMSISLNQQEILKPIFNYTFYNYLQSYQYFNNSLLEGVYCYNFGLYPEENQPSGTANFSMFKGKLFNFTLNPNFINEYFNTYFNPNQLGLLLKFMARSYNFFVIEKGMGRMIFATS